MSGSALPPALVPPVDTRIWRVVGDPLVSPTQDGPLTGETIAVKDLYAVQGHRIGAGNPAWLAHATPQREHAVAVRTLLDAGASVRGIASADEFAYSLSGQNAHYGAPPNPRAPGRICGGSTSGSATAVSMGHATIGLGTDTGGSIRVPAAYQGLFGIRTTHGAVDRTGLLPLAPTFDTVGWLTQSAALLAAVGDVLLPTTQASGSPDLVVVPGLLELARPDVVTAIEEWLPPAVRESHGIHELGLWLGAFQTWQGFEAWRAHGMWLRSRLDSLGGDVRGRFEIAARLSSEQAVSAWYQVQAARYAVRKLVGDRVLILPSAASVAPVPGEAQAGRDATMRLTCLAGLGGLPAVSLPLRTADGLPCGVCLVAGAGRDRDLLELAVRLGS